MDRRDSLAQLFTDDDVETLKHLAREGTGENTCGLRVGSRLFGDVGGNRHGPAAVLAGDGGARAEIRCASSLGPGQAREPSPTWDARRRCRELASGGVAAVEARMPETPSSGAWRTGAHCIGGGGSRDRSLRRACFRPWRLAVRASSRPRERKSKRAVAWDVLRSVDRDLRDGSSSRCPGSRDRSLGVRVRRAPAQRSGAPARRAAEG